MWSFQTGGTKLERFLPKNQHTQRKLFNFENWVNGEVSKSVKKCQNLTFKVNFLCQKLSEFFSIFLHWRILLQEHIFCYWHFLITSIFKSLYLLKWCPIFDTSPLHQFSKFNNFIWLQLIFRQKPFHFCIPGLETP